MRFDNIQLLRVLAAVTVVGYHLNVYATTHFGVPAESTRSLALWGYGLFPVPLFFAVSGFVLTHALHSARPGRFLLARAIRLYPGYWIALFLAAILISDTSLLADLREVARRMSKTEIFLSPSGTGTPRMYLLGIEWSLIYEVVLSIALALLACFGLRRGLPIAVGAWLAIIAVKMAVWPGFAMSQLPHWRTILISAYNTPFLSGVLAYYLRGSGRKLRWLVLASTLGLAAWGPPMATSMEQCWCIWGLVGAAAVWFSTQIRQVSSRNPLARLGDCTYGLYLIHVPIILALFRLFRKQDWMLGTLDATLVVGLAALLSGFTFGRLESWLHCKLRPLARSGNISISGLRLKRLLATTLPIRNLLFRAKPNAK